MKMIVMNDMSRSHSLKVMQQQMVMDLEELHTDASTRSERKRTTHKIEASSAAAESTGSVGGPPVRRPPLALNLLLGLHRALSSNH